MRFVSLTIARNDKEKDRREVVMTTGEAVVRAADADCGRANRKEAKRLCEY